MKSLLRILVWSSLLAPLCVAAGLPPVTYNGHLLLDGAPANGMYDLVFSIWDSETGGQQLGGWTTNSAVTVSSGTFEANLDLNGVVFDGSPRWLEIWVRTNSPDADFTVLAPRQPLSTVPQALFALTAGNAGLATNLVGGGATLSAVPAGSLVGQIPLAALSGITSNQIDAATDAAYRSKPGQKGVITPFDFGAVGDGIHDDTAALQAWINRACSEGDVAFLPPAPGGYYKFTDTLWASNSLTMIGGGGGKHSMSYPYTRSILMQFTPGKDGLVLASPNDSVHLASLAIMAEPPGNQTNDCYGVWFAGGAPDADCSIVEQCLVTGFGTGIKAASEADSTFRECSLGLNGTGIVIEGVANNVSLDSCQLSYNSFRQVYVHSGAKVTIANSDINAISDSAQGLYCQGQQLIMIGDRFEDYSTNACLIGAQPSRITLLCTSFLNYSSAPRYSVIITNGFVVTLNSIFGCLGPAGVPILDVGVGKSSILAIPPVEEYLSIGRAGFVTTASTFTAGRASWTGAGPGPSGIGHNGWAYPGTLEWGWGIGSWQADQALWAYANMQAAGYSGLQAVDLLEFAKEQRLGLQGNGATLTNLVGANIQLGSITTNQIDPATDSAYRNDPNTLTNNYSDTVNLQKDLKVMGNLELPSGTLVVNTNSPPADNTPKAWIDVKTPDGHVWKLGLYQ